LSDLNKPGITLKAFDPKDAKLVEVNDSRTRSVHGSGPPSAVRLLNVRESVDFDEALANGRVLPDAERNAFAALRALRRRLKPGDVLVQENRLRALLEEKGQRVLLWYLEGDGARKPGRDDYRAAAAFYEAARLLSPESIYLEALAAFFQGRAAAEDKNHIAARQALERSIRLDPNGAYAYNGLGIVYLELGESRLAQQAFHDALARAPRWIYPMTGLALALEQDGLYEEALAQYAAAAAGAPGAAYAHHNRGLLLQRLNRLEEAEAAHRRALEISPDKPIVRSGWAALCLARGRVKDAETEYRAIATRWPEFMEARHGLAESLRRQPGRTVDAIAELRSVLDRETDFLPARESLIAALEESRRPEEAAAEMRGMLARQPEFQAIRLRLALFELGRGQAATALALLRESPAEAAGSLATQEALGDAAQASGENEAARSAWTRALALAPDRADRQRLERKLAGRR